MTSTAYELAGQIAGEMGIPAAEPMTGEQAAEFRAEFERTWAQRKYEPLKVLSPRPMLTPETARELLRECVTVVQPGETLVVRASDSWTPVQVRELQNFADAMTGYRELGVSILFMPGEEFAVMKAASA